MIFYPKRKKNRAIFNDPHHLLMICTISHHQRLLFISLRASNQYQIASFYRMRKHPKNVGILDIISNWLPGTSIWSRESLPRILKCNIKSKFQSMLYFRPALTSQYLAYWNYLKNIVITPKLTYISNINCHFKTFKRCLY